MSFYAVSVAGGPVGFLLLRFPKNTTGKIDFLFPRVPVPLRRNWPQREAKVEV
jgi:hypothetical protein